MFGLWSNSAASTKRKGPAMPRGKSSCGGCGEPMRRARILSTKHEIGGGARRGRNAPGVYVGRVAVNNHRPTVDSSDGFRLSRPSPYSEIAARLAASDRKG